MLWSADALATRYSQEAEQQKQLVSQGWQPNAGSSVYVPRLDAMVKVTCAMLAHCIGCKTFADV